LVQGVIVGTGSIGGWHGVEVDIDMVVVKRKEFKLKGKEGAWIVMYIMKEGM
jgi:hypothetical protein